MYNISFIRSGAIITLLLLSFMTKAQESGISSIAFDSVKYEMTMRALLEKANDLGAHRGKIGLDFADQYNIVVKQFPDKIQHIEVITRSVADEYGLSYETEGGIITTARFASVGSKGVEPSIPNENAAASPQEVFKVVEQMPRFPGCENLEDDQKYQCANQRLIEFVYADLKYPEAAKIAGVEGRVIVQFIVEENGELTNINIVRDIGHGCGAEAVRIVNSMNVLDEKWIPGKQRGKPVRVQFTLPIQFKL